MQKINRELNIKNRKLIFIKNSDKHILYHQPNDKLLKYCLLADSLDEEYFVIRTITENDKLNHLDLFKTSIYISLFANEIKDGDIGKYFEGILSKSQQSSVYKFLFVSDKEKITSYLKDIYDTNLKMYLSKNFVSLSTEYLEKDYDYENELNKAKGIS